MEEGKEEELGEISAAAWWWLLAAVGKSFKKELFTALKPFARIPKMFAQSVSSCGLQDILDIERIRSCARLFLT